MYKKEGKDLHDQIAILARKLAKQIIDPISIKSLIACRLIPLNKNPGVRPIGIGEILRRIIGKTIGWVLKSDIQETHGPLQTSTGLKGGAEAAIHAIKEVFDDDETEAVILVDASNAFNALNRNVALHNIQIICLPFSTVLINTYREPARLFITGGKELLAMSFYGLSTRPLQTILRIKSPAVKQVWLADDATGAGKLKQLKEWCDKEFKSIVNTLGFSQLVDKATRITHTSSTLIDLILSNRPENISTISVFTTSFSDHDMVGCVRKLNNIKYPMRSIKCRDYSKYNHENLSNDVKKINWEPVYKSSDVNSAVTYFNSELRKVFDKYAPIIEKRIKGKSCKWLNSDLRKEMNNRDKQMRNARKTNSDEDWTSYRKMRNECNKNVKRAKSNYHQDILKENITNPQ